MADRPPKEKSQVEGLPKNSALFSWLEGLFYGPENYPQKIEVCLCWGSRFERKGPPIKLVVFPPNMVDPAERVETTDKPDSAAGGRAERRKHKPGREELIELAHDITQRIQMECDATGKGGVYFVLATHLAIDDQPFERFPFRANPKGPRAQGAEDGGDDDDEMGGMKAMQKAFLLGMRQNQEMFNLLGSMIEGVIDRADRQAVRAEEALEATRSQNLRMQDVVARAMDVENERKIKYERHQMGMKVLDRGINMFEAYAPQWLPGLIGDGAGNGEKIIESPESMTLKAFLRPVEAGGQLTEAQIDAVFGVFDDTPDMKLIRPGVLTEAQGRIIHHVAFLKVRAEELEKFLPGGEHPLTSEQLMRLQGVFKDSMDQIAPLIGLFGMINQKVQARNAKKEG